MNLLNFFRCAPLLLLVGLGCDSTATPATDPAPSGEQPSTGLYEFEALSLEGESKQLSDYSGQVTLVGQCRQQMRLHASIRWAASFAHPASRPRLRCARLPEQRVPWTGTRRCGSDPVFLHGQLRSDLSSLRKVPDALGRQSVPGVQLYGKRAG